MVIWEDKWGCLWLGMLLGGFNFYDLKVNMVKAIIKGQGFFSNMVMSIMEDEEGDFWVGMEYGINFVFVEGLVLNSFYQEDGLIYDIFEWFDFFKDEDGKLWFGSWEGVSIIDFIVLKNEF